MQRVSEIMDATLSPTKAQMVEAVMGESTMWGAFRFVDPHGEVGIESILLRDGDVVRQCAVTYRADHINPEHELCTMQHSVLGSRAVTRAVADPVAVLEFVRVILEGDTNAQRSDGILPPLDIRGTGTAGVDTLTLVDAELATITSDTVSGTCVRNGEKKHFQLHIPLVPELVEQAPALALIGTDKDGSLYVLATVEVSSSAH
ncbi:MAG: hypothetical protein Q4A31_11180 [Corynebacterium sp.]|uniref:CG0192 family protein n=1 Tax=Corynebacterium sp. TaxID=1720 RepID=UPI0026DB32C0|nr:hypothetical protein [Corynebacterium sp.]MDO4762473.1 hypothetical protein [Corynebacterium sp.]